jgi:hypothetical protein
MKGSAVRVRASALARFAGLSPSWTTAGIARAGTKRVHLWTPSRLVKGSSRGETLCLFAGTSMLAAWADVSDRESRKCPRGDVRARVSPAVFGRSTRWHIRTLPRLDVVDHGGNTLPSQRFHLDCMTRPRFGPRTFITTVCGNRSARTTGGENGHTQGFVQLRTTQRYLRRA